MGSSSCSGPPAVQTFGPVHEGPGVYTAEEAGGSERWKMLCLGLSVIYTSQILFVDRLSEIILTGSKRNLVVYALCIIIVVPYSSYWYMLRVLKYNNIPEGEVSPCVDFLMMCNPVGLVRRELYRKRGRPALRICKMSNKYTRRFDENARAHSHTQTHTNSSLWALV